MRGADAGRGFPEVNLPRTRSIHELRFRRDLVFREVAVPLRRATSNTREAVLERITICEASVDALFRGRRGLADVRLDFC